MNDSAAAIEWLEDMTNASFVFDGCGRPLLQFVGEPWQDWDMYGGLLGNYEEWMTAHWEHSSDSASWPTPRAAHDLDGKYRR